MKTIKHILKASLVKWFLPFYLFTFLPLHAQIGTWRAYMSYYEPQQIVKAGSYTLFVRASNSLYSYNLNDHSITTFDNVNTLSDNYISQIAWNQKVKRLMVVYESTNIDLLDLDGDVTNISSYYSKFMTKDKTVNNIYIYNEFAYLCTGFGIVKINMDRAEISESYILDQNINAIVIDNKTIYVRNQQGVVYKATLTDNLIDKTNWQTTTTYPEFTTDNTDWDTYQPVVATLKPEGPKYNYFGFMSFNNGILYTVGGGWKDGSEFLRPFCAQILKDGNEWTSLDKNDITPLTGTRLTDATSIAVNPSNPNHYFVTTCGTGLYEFLNGKMVQNFTSTNSPIVSALDEKDANAANYVRVDGLFFDHQNNVWMSNSSSKAKTPLLKYNLTSNKWTSYNNSELFYQNSPLRIIRNAIIDHNGNAWMVNDHHNHPCVIRLNPDNDTFTRYENFTNQDGISYGLNYVRCIAQDLDKNIWIGTEQGVFLYDSQQQENNTLGFTQVKVPRNDGTDYADYLMTGVNITSIAIDGGNRKWIGTDGNGVYLISADNMEQIHHFTINNSPLLSDIIESIAINDNTGEVFFGTKNGLCSYMSDATSSATEMTKDNVYAYPNPVEPGYTGLITVVGLSFDADVKILTSSGRLVAQGRSNGGTFTWDGCDQQGKRVASGIYMIATATSNGSDGIVGKIAIIR